MDFNATVSRICQLKNLFQLTKLDWPELSEMQFTIEDVPTDIFDRLIALYDIKKVGGIDGWRKFMLHDADHNYHIHIHEAITITSN